jgi:hypothetical protein
MRANINGDAARMMRIPPWVPAMLAGLLAACAAWGGGTEGARKSWDGARYEDVASQWGAPARSAKLPDGQLVHTWVSPTARVGIFGGSGGGGAAASFPLPGMGSDPQKQCERTLTIKDGYVIQQVWAGTDEFCSPFKKR